MNRYLCIHGHFYQPPRENAWLEDVELQDSAHPYHDWNDRITAEGYAPNTASRIFDGAGRIVDIVNNYTRISFNFGPTLLSWMEREKPDIYDEIIRADVESRSLYGGHGSAIAQVYNHMIMPLANRRDRNTQVIWGIRDFSSRFGRDPEGMWLPETAADTETLEVLADHGIRFTILSPYQAKEVLPPAGKWTDASGGQIDPRRPYLCRLPSGREIVLFFYDGPISQEVGFGKLLDNGEVFAQRLVDAFLEDREEAQLVHIATDGETYGHHHRHGDMALAYCLHHVESNELARITVYGEYLEHFPPTWEARILERTAWSCIHGVGRWETDCGCNSGMHGGWTQLWRAPLRNSLNWLRDRLVPVYEEGMAAYSRNPWRMRDHYIDVILNRSPEQVDRFMTDQLGRTLEGAELIRFLHLLEMQRQAMLMFTSCGWFFDEISGLETTQILQYAARAIQLAREVGGTDLESHFVDLLRGAPSNLMEYRDGSEIYRKFVRTAEVDLLRVGAHFAISSLFEENPSSGQVYCFDAESERYDRMRAGRVSLVVGEARITSRITFSSAQVSFTVLHLGGHILYGGIREYEGESNFERMHREMRKMFLKSDIPEVIRMLDEHFGTHSYTLWHLFKDKRRQVFMQILESSLEGAKVHFRQIFENDYSLMQAMMETQIPIPQALRVPAYYTLDSDLMILLEGDRPDLNGLRNLMEERKKFGMEGTSSEINLAATDRTVRLMEELSENPDDRDLLGFIGEFLTVLESAPFDLDFWKAQNLFFLVGRDRFEWYRELAEEQTGSEEQEAREWLELFSALGDRLRVRIR